jgi:rare lipoprotein A
MKSIFKVFLSTAFVFLCGANLQAQNAEYGEASYYNDKYHRQPTASGELYDKGAMTAAHKQLPFGTMIKVTRLDNGKSVIVRVNDRGPFKAGRIVDLSRVAAEKIGLITDGVTNVKLEIIDKESEKELAVKTQKSTKKEVAKPVKTKSNSPKMKSKNVSQKTTNTYTNKVGEMDGFYKVSMEKVPSGNYSVQVGTYNSYENMMNQVAKLHEKWFSDVIVQVDNSTGTKIYKVCVGNLETREAANEYKKNVEKKIGIKGFVVDLD